MTNALVERDTLSTGGVAIRAFGTMEVVSDGATVPVTSHLQRVLLSALLVHRGAVVPVPTLVGWMWPTGAPEAAMRNLRFHAHRLRRLLGDVASIRYQAPGYVLTVPDTDVDVCCFESLAHQGRAARASGDEPGGAALLRQAISLCRGPAFHGLEEVAELAIESQRLSELRLAVLEERIAAELALGTGSAALVSELTALVATHPFRERFRAQLMTALYRCGRKADALGVYRDGRQLLIDELGIEPNPECQAIERAILSDDISLTSPHQPERPQPRIPAAALHPRFLARTHRSPTEMAVATG